MTRRKARGRDRPGLVLWSASDRLAFHTEIAEGAASRHCEHAATPAFHVNCAGCYLLIERAAAVVQRRRETRLLRKPLLTVMGVCGCTNDQLERGITCGQALCPNRRRLGGA
jgi:hypothetical protein